MMAAAVAAVTPRLHFAVKQTCLSPKSSAFGQVFLRLSQPVGDALHLEPHGVPRRFRSSSLHSQRDWRSKLCPLLLLCQQSPCATAQLSESTSPNPVLDSEDVVSSDFPISHSPINPEAKNGEAYKYVAALGGLGLLACALQFPEVSSAAIAVKESSFPMVDTFAGAEPSNALSLPTWVIHVASVVEWLTAMVLVWKYGDTEGKSAWKGLTWGMVPLLGGAMCACTWHFFYNAESLEVLVVLQAFLTVVGNCTLWAAAYRIWKLSRGKITVD
ncbi:unnamed protein product [Calypogeia fissa]